MLHQIKVPQLYNGLGLQIALNPPVNGKIQGLFKTFECFFQILFKANLIFKDFSRQSCIFKYFSSLCRDKNSQPFSIRKICRLTPKWRKAIFKSLIKGLKSQNINRNQSV